MQPTMGDACQRCGGSGKEYTPVGQYKTFKVCKFCNGTGRNGPRKL